MSANETQVGGVHYQSPLQHWDFVALCRIGYMRARIMAYIQRWKKKNGVQDLRKGEHFYRKLMENLGTPVDEQLEVPLRCAEVGITLADYFKANEVGAHESYVISMLLSRDYDNMALGLQKLQQMIEEQTGGEYDIELEDTTALKTELTDVRAKLQGANEELTRQQTEIADLKTKVETAEKAAADAESKVAVLTEDRSKADTEIAELKAKLADAAKAAAHPAPKGSKK